MLSHKSSGAIVAVGTRQLAKLYFAHRQWRFAAMFLVAIASPCAASAGPDIGPTASTSIGISVSIAAKYKLLARGGVSADPVKGQGHPDQFCIATNSNAMLLPVLLLWPSGSGPQRSEPDYERPADAVTTPILSCELAKRNSGTKDHILTGNSGVQYVLVRPE